MTTRNSPTRKYLIDYELTGSLLIESTNPRAAAARARAVLEAVQKGLNVQSPDDADLRIGSPIDLAKKAVPQ